MGKKRIDSNISLAIEALKEFGIVENGKCDPKYRSQISAFGASVIMGSFKSAVAFYSKQGNADVDRSLLIKAIHYVANNRSITDPETIFTNICDAQNISELQSAYLDASVSLKLAMNFFDMGKGGR